MISPLSELLSFTHLFLSIYLFSPFIHHTLLFLSLTHTLPSFHLLHLLLPLPSAPSTLPPFVD